MHFKLPDGVPGLRADNQEWADYAEFQAISTNSTSFVDLIRPSLRISDEIDNLGTEDDTDRYLQKSDEIAAEIRRRNSLLGNRYPYTLEHRDYNIRHTNLDTAIKQIYLFLLLCTRVKMSTERIHENIDGALIFEHLCAEMVKNYFGIYSEVDILGTSSTDSTSFREKLQGIFTKIGEGGQIHKNPSFRPQDDKVDLILWINFNDKQPSKFIAFGQCKTGTSWVGSISELNAGAFCKRWFSRQPLITPVEMFFTAQYFPRDIWYERASEAGLVFDRFRILSYLPESIDETLLSQITSWNTSVLRNLEVALQ